jgi:uncharacterized protein (TIGR02145 family)
MYECLTGTVPFKAESPINIINKIVNEKPLSIANYRADVPKSIESILDSLLDKDLNMRPDSGELLIKKLKQRKSVSTKSMVESEPPIKQGYVEKKVRAKMNNSTVFTVLIFIFLAILGLLGYIFVSKHLSLRDISQNNEYKGNAGTFTDERDGHTYKWVKIGNQIWMAENLAYLPKVNRITDGSENDLNGKYYYVIDYDGSFLKQAKESLGYQNYGVLYNWNAAMVTCPFGWHIPRNEEWDQLVQFIVKEQKVNPSENDRYSNILQYLTKKDSWGPLVNSKNIYGFSVLPSGFRSKLSYYKEWKFYRSWNDISQNIGGFMAAFWSSTKLDDRNVYGRSIDTFACNACFFKQKFNINEGLSIRCIKD